MLARSLALSLFPSTFLMEPLGNSSQITICRMKFKMHEFHIGLCLCDMEVVQIGYLGVNCYDWAKHYINLNLATTFTSNCHSSSMKQNNENFLKWLILSRMNITMIKTKSYQKSKLSHDIHSRKAMIV